MSVRAPYDKDTYWKNRTAGVRGQGIKKKDVFFPYPAGHITRTDGSYISEKRNPEEYQTRKEQLEKEAAERKPIKPHGGKKDE